MKKEEVYGIRTRNEDVLYLTILSRIEALEQLPKLDVLDGLPQPDTDFIDETDTKKLKGKEDPKAKTLHPDALKLYRSANKSYISGKNKQPFIPLNSATRSCESQARLFRAYVHYEYYDGPFAPNANRPGQSNHEYGLAIDVNLKVDKRRITNALRDADWTDDKASEPWHFEAQDVAAYSAAKKVRSELKEPSLKVALSLGSWFEHRKESLEIKAAYEKEKKRLEPKRKRLKTIRDRLREDNQSLRQRKIALDREASAINDLKSANSVLRRRIDRMRYKVSSTKTCPNGREFEDCGHEDLKAAYRREKRSLERKWERANDEITSRYRDWSSETREYRIDRTKYQREYRDFLRDKRQFDKDARELKRLQSNFRKKLSEMKKIEATEKKLLASIQGRINKFLQG